MRKRDIRDWVWGLRMEIGSGKWGKKFGSGKILRDILWIVSGDRDGEKKTPLAPTSE